MVLREVAIVPQVGSGPKAVVEIGLQVVLRTREEAIVPQVVLSAKVIMMEMRTRLEASATSARHLPLDRTASATTVERRAKATAITY